MKNGVLRCVFIAAGAALIINGIAVLICANFTIGTLLTILLGLVLLLPAAFSDLTKRLLKHTLFKLLSVTAMFCCVVMVLSTVFLYGYGNNNTAVFSEDYLLILGCGVRGDVPSLALCGRLDTALEYLEDNGECQIIVSGGQGPGENISEAEAMRRYLVERGVDNDRILLEDKSTSTTENFRFSNSLVDGGLANKSAVFVTSDFHIYRAAMLARLQGFSLNHIGAPTAWYNIAPSYLREFLAIGQMYLLRK